jgi:hypothetical protein
VVRCGGEIGAYTTQLHFRRWEMVGALPRTRHSGEALWYVVVLNQMRSTTCKTACPKQVIGILQLYNNGLAINLILLIGDSAKPL